MSSHHKAPMAAFVVVVVACLVILVQAVRGDALGFLRPAPSMMGVDEGMHLGRLAFAPHASDRGTAPAASSVVGPAHSGVVTAAVPGHAVRGSGAGSAVVAAVPAVLTDPTPWHTPSYTAAPDRSHGKAGSADHASHGPGQGTGHGNAKGHGKAEGHGRAKGHQQSARARGVAVDDAPCPHHGHARH